MNPTQAKTVSGTRRFAERTAAIVLLALCATPANAEPNGIILYATSNWTGDSLTVHESNITNLGEYGWNDRVRSFTVTGGRWIMYRDEVFDGNKGHDVEGPFGVGDHTFGDCSDCFSGQATSLLRLPDDGIMVFEHSKFRGRHLNIRTSVPRLRHEHDIDTGFLGLGQVFDPEFVWGDNISSYAVGSGDWTGYEDSGYRGYSGHLTPGGLRNDAISSLYRADDRGLSEVTSVDDRLQRPRNPVALDSGNWGAQAVTLAGIGETKKLALPPNRGIVSTMDIRLNGFSGTFYTTCAGLAMFHTQHVIRLPNKDGRAYFAVTMSDKSADLDASVGFWLVFRLDDDAYDAATDRFVDTPGTDGEYIWSQQFNAASPFGDWNHPGKMAVLGGVLVMAAEQWSSSWCDSYMGTSVDAVLFYDVRDPESPKFWGKITADELQIANQDREVLGDPANAGGAERRVINSVTLDHIGGEVLLGVGGNRDRKLFKARGGIVAPYAAAWEHIGDSSLMSNSHGNNFNSFEQNATGPDGAPGIERIMFYDGYIRDECPFLQACWPNGRTMSASSVLFSGGGGGDTFTVPAGNSVKATRAAAGAGGTWTWPKGGEKSEDASSIHVTTFQQPVVYIPELAWDAQPWTEAGPDDINGVPVVPATSTLQKNIKDGPFVDAGGYGYYNRFYQVHLPEPATTVTIAGDSGEGSLRSVIANLPTGGVVDFAAALDGAVISLTSGEIEVLRKITVDASSLPSGVTVQGSNGRVFSVGAAGDLVLNKVTVTGGSAPGGSGGGLRNEGRLELIDCTVTGNTATIGGGIWNENGSVRLTNTTVSGNGATDAAGGIGNLGAASSLEIVRSTISGNTATNVGSGVVTYGGSVDAINSTISGNSENGGGGGLRVQGDSSVSLTHCTVDNQVDAAFASSPPSLLNTIAASFIGDVDARGANLFGSHVGSVSSGPAPTISPALGLGALADNGGTTLTQSPQSGSPAIDAGTYQRGVSSEDQRLYARGSIPDIGAVETPDLNLEFLSLPSAPLTPDLSPAVSAYSSSVSFGAGDVAVGARPSDPTAIVEVSLNGGEFVSTLGGPSNGASEYLPIRPLSLSVGPNMIDVRVSTPDRAFEKTVTVSVTREPASSDANLSFLATSLMNLDPVFDSATTSYDAGVTSARDFRLWAEAQTSVASIEVRVNGGAYYMVPPATGISAGNQHSLAIREGANTVTAWGSDRDLSGAEEPAGQSTIDGTVTNAVSVAGGDSHSLVLASTGRVSAWGSDVFGQSSVPALSGGLAVAAGANHSLALVSTGGGRVVAWGDDSSGQASVPAAAQSGVVRIAAGESHSLALKDDGTVVAWGDDFYDQTTGMPGGLSDVVAIAAGFTHSLALKSDGTVVRWGEELNGGLSDVPSDLSGVVAIAAGDGVSLALKGDGEIVAWGGLADCETESLVSGATAIAVGRAHRLAVRGNHSVVAWGSNNAGQTEVPGNLVTPMPTSPLLSLEPGSNTVEVRVTAEDGTVKLYTVSLEQDDAAVIDTFDPAPSSLFAVINGTKRPFENITLVGQRVHYRVTGSATAGSVWGSAPYTLDSNIATTAVHAGVLADGEEGIVTLEIVDAITDFVGTTQNGVASKNFSSPNPDPPTAIEIMPFTGDPYDEAREVYFVEPGPPPVDLRCHGNRLGETLNYLVVGSAPVDPDNPKSQQAIWYQAANDIYSHDSSLAVAAVHAGILEHGQTGIVAVTIGDRFSFNSSEEQDDTQLQNGVIPAKRGDNHSSVVGGSYSLARLTAFDPEDSDGDGLSDSEEALESTDPEDADSDDDGMLDAWEVANGLDPLSDDTEGDADEDGVSNGDEHTYGTDPNDPDTDGDGMTDAWEIENSLNPSVDDSGLDIDGDGYTNGEEFDNGTDPVVWNPPPGIGVVCGDGLVEGAEACDDGNTAAGDCCSPSCEFDPADTACGSDADVCTSDVCDGAGNCTHPNIADPSCSVLCIVDFYVEDGTDVESVQWDTDYGRAPGDFATDGRDVVCSAGEGMSGRFYANDTRRTLTAEVTDLTGSPGSRHLASCEFASAPGLSGQAFVNEIRRASDLDGLPVDVPGVSMEVGCQTCGAPVTGSSPPLATDCLGLLFCAVGISQCDLCVGDVNGDGNMSATDALRCLVRAVGNDVPFACECDHL